MKLYNSLTNKLEKFKPIEPNKVKMYVCGPTVYNYIHIGNARPQVVFDTLGRYLKDKGYEVTYVQNFTDIDDKIIAQSIKENIPSSEISEKYINAFLEDIKKLNLLEDVIRPKVTENIPEIIEIISRLIEKDYAYVSNGDVFFDIKKYKDYGKLSNQNLDELEVGVRVEISADKKNPLDFVLWKKKKDGEPYWESPWSQGRPGWHIECSAMSRKYLGETFDIHGGGLDLLFPHHENEIAQSRCAYDGEFAKYWLHNGYINLEGEKMSKSKGNFLLLRKLIEKFSGNVIRLFILSSHYRKPMNFSFEELEKTERTLKNIENSMKRLSNSIVNKNDLQSNVDDTIFLSKIEEYDKEFDSAMDDDINTPKALATVFNQITETNKYIDFMKSDLILKKSFDSLNRKITKVLGIVLNYNDGNEIFFRSIDTQALMDIIRDVAVMAKKNKKETLSNIIPTELEHIEALDSDKKWEINSHLIDTILLIRANARIEKDYELSDKVRDDLLKLNIAIKDNKDGTTAVSKI